MKNYESESLDGSPRKTLKLRNSPLTWVPQFVVNLCVKRVSDNSTSVRLKGVLVKSYYLLTRQAFAPMVSTYAGRTVSWSYP